MKRDEEEGFFDQRDMVPVKRTSAAWNMYTEDDAMSVDSHKAPRPPPAHANPGHWNAEESGLTTTSVALDLHRRTLVDQADGIPMANGSQAD
eukprot:655481-Amphidinium_carterae.1